MAIPGEVRGYQRLHERWGRLPWKDLFEPAARVAEQGFPAGEFLMHLIDTVKEELREFPQLARMLRRPASQLRAGERFAVPARQREVLREGRWIRRGQLLKNKPLAATLRTLAVKGPEWFYTGAMAGEIVGAARRHGGVLTREDLASFEATWREPVQAEFRGHQVFSMPPPSSGGAVLIELLNVLDHFPLERLGKNSSAYLHILAEALKHAFADRAEFMGDPGFVEVPLERLLSPQHARRIARAIHPLRTREIERYRHQLPEDHGTNHIVVVDAAGNVVSATSTINYAFGSLVVVPNRGFVLNNEMDDFSIQPGVPNAFGLVGGEANAVAPGKKPLSSMTPTLVLKDGKPVLALGAAGGPRIITGTLQTLLNVLVFGDDVQEAMDTPRIHHQWLPDILRCEDALPRDVLEPLGQRGHRIQPTKSLANRVQAVAITPGGLEAASDPREQGQPAGY